VAGGVDAIVGDGQALPYADGSFDAGFSMFGLMFFPDRARGFSELHRVLRAGARAVVSSWLDFTSVPEMRATYGTLAELSPQGRPPRPGLPLSDPAACVEEMSAAGFSSVRVEICEGIAEHASTEAMISHMVRASAPVALLRRSLGEEWPELERRWRERVLAQLGPGPHRVRMPAYLTVGTR
jgi:SAM-dependent methyltransferase